MHCDDFPQKGWAAVETKTHSLGQALRRDGKKKL